MSGFFIPKAEGIGMGMRRLPYLDTRHLSKEARENLALAALIVLCLAGVVVLHYA